MKKSVLKEQLKNLIKGKSLYNKELRVLVTVLLCFVVCGISLPAIAKSLPYADAGAVYESGVSETTEGISGDNDLSDAESSDMETDGETGSDNNTSEEALPDGKDTHSKSNHSGSSVSSGGSQSKGNSVSSGKGNSSGAASNEGSGNRGNGSSNSQSTSSGQSSGHSGGSSQSSGGGSSSGNGSHSSSQPSSPAAGQGNSNKVWVPPVYETVHHDAVYEKVKIVICNYCGAEFGSVGEFQVHKDAHGG